MGYGRAPAKYAKKTFRITKSLWSSFKPRKIWSCHVVLQRTVKKGRKT